MQADPISDLLTCIRNGLHSHKERVEVPWSRVKEAIVKVAVGEGFLNNQEKIEEKGKYLLRIWLKYDVNGRPAIRGLTRVSKPSLRTYAGAKEIPLVQNGLGVNVISTSKGVLPDREARKLNVGGEVLCSLW